MKELLHSFEYEGIGRALQNEGADKGGRCRAFPLLPVLQEADKGTGAGGLTLDNPIWIIQQLAAVGSEKNTIQQNFLQVQSESKQILPLFQNISIC
jgi:hypothetical protein